MIILKTEFRSRHGKAPCNFFSLPWKFGFMRMIRLPPTGAKFDHLPLLGYCHTSSSCLPFHWHNHHI